MNSYTVDHGGELSVVKRISILKLHFETQGSSCKSEQMAKLYKASAKTLEDLEKELIKSGDSPSQEEVWKDNAYTFLV